MKGLIYDYKTLHCMIIGKDTLKRTLEESYPVVVDITTSFDLATLILTTNIKCGEAERVLSIREIYQKIETLYKIGEIIKIMVYDKDNLCIIYK